MHGSRRVLFTADRPNGPMHIGHYVGSIRNRLAYQGRHDQYIMIADHLALTDNVDPRDIARNVVRIGLDYLATGIDPEVNTLFIQSRVEPLSALTALLNPRGFRDDAPASMVSQVADIAAFGADGVPVGSDQIPLVRFAADLVRRFNEKFGDVLVVPAPISPMMGRLPGIDGRPKMGNSLHNAIYLADDPDVVTDKILRIAMTADGAEFDPETSPPFVYLREFHPVPSEVADIAERYAAGALADFEIRHILLDVLQDFLEPIRKRRAEFDTDHAEVLGILRAGSERATDTAAGTLDRVRTAMGLHYSAGALVVGRHR